MELVDLKTNTKTGAGRSVARAIRREGRVPAVLYGKKDPVLLSMDYADLEMVRKKSRAPQVFIRLTIDDQPDNKIVMIKEYQRDPVSQRLLHADLYEIDMDHKITLFVPVVMKGKCKGIEAGGHLQIIRRELAIRCLPSLVPENIEIDVTDLGVGDSIHVKDVAPMEGVEIPAEVNFTIITVVAPKASATEAAQGSAETVGETAAQA